MSGFGFVAAFAQLVSFSETTRRRRLRKLMQLLSRSMLRVMGVHCKVDVAPGFETHSKRSRLFLPNHVSYVDVLVLNAYFPAISVTSREIEETPVLGWVTKAAGCAFVERRHIWDVQRDVIQLAELLERGNDVTLFPEGSTSPGDRLLPFKRSLVEAACRSRCRVVPICLKYESIDGEPYSSANCDDVAWYGDMTFFPHLWRLMQTKSIEVRLSVLGEVSFREHKSRRKIIEDARTRIARKLSS